MAAAKLVLSLLLAGPACYAADAAIDAQTWNAKAAAAYLDQRAEWWTTWPNAARSNDTYCVSCHTAAPYALGRPALRQALGERTASPAEQKLVANVEKRVRLWTEVQPYYKSSDKAPIRTEQSRGTEAVLNALVLTAAAKSSQSASPLLSQAIKNMWDAQITAEGPANGAFLWLDFHNRPWEADDSQYYGSALAAITVAMLPADQPKPGAAALVAYLRREYATQSLVNKSAVLWAASTSLPALLTADEKKALLREIAATQSEDGGFSLTAVAGPWKRADGTSLETKSDGYATGLIAYALERAGVPAKDHTLAAALRWLRANQSATEGRWLAYSMNKNRDLNTDIGRFMSDAATAYAVMALTTADAPR